MSHEKTKENTIRWSSSLFSLEELLRKNSFFSVTRIAPHFQKQRMCRRKYDALSERMALSIQTLNERTPRVEIMAEIFPV